MKRAVLLSLVVLMAALTLAIAISAKLKPWRAFSQPAHASRPPDEYLEPLRNELVIGSLPPATIVADRLSLQSGYSKAYEFGVDWHSEHMAIWRKCLAAYKDRPDVRYLEIGVYQGRSIIWMLENILTHPTAHATGVDPFFNDGGFDEKPYKEILLSNVSLGGFASRITIIEGFSQIELRKLPIASYDIIYIDGSHREDDTLEDAILAHRLLKEGGVMIFDDYQLDDHHQAHPKPAIDAFYHFWGAQYDVLHLGWQAMLRKKVVAVPTALEADGPSPIVAPL